MTDEQIKVLEELRDDGVLAGCIDVEEQKALTAVLEYVRDMREIEEAAGRIELNGNGIDDLGVIERDWDRDSNFWLVEGPSWQGPASVDSEARFNNLREAFKAVKGGKE